MMHSTCLSNVRALAVIATFVLPSAACVEEAAIQQPEVGAPRQTARTIAPKFAALSNPVVTTDRSAKDYYLDLERCRGDVAGAMGGTGSDDVAALRRALADQTDGLTVVVPYKSADRAVVRDRAVKSCLAKKGYAVKL